MSDLLTTTGLIATLVAVFFALAGLYVSHRRRPADAAPTPPNRTPQPPVAAQADLQSPVSQPPLTAPLPQINEVPQEPVAVESNPLWTHSAFSTGATGSPLFERLGKGPKGKPAPEPSAPSVETSGRYAWD